jgi:hypothetical protein
MPDYIFLMHSDTTTAEDLTAWGPYFASLRAHGAFEGGSAMGGGAAFRKSGAAAALSPVEGFIRVNAPSLEAACAFLSGNPVYEAGGTVEIRELPEG